jgi:L-fuculose-phosphate aldolase
MPIPFSQGILESGRRLVEAGLSDGTSGNVSVRPSDGAMIITPSSLDFRLQTELDLVEIDLRSGAARGRRRPSSVWRLHALIFEKRPDVQAVVHHHGPWSTAAAVARTTVPVLVDEAADIGQICTAPYAPSASDELAEIVSDELTHECNAVLLANHGAVAVGRTLHEALRRAHQVERSTKIYIGALVLGGAHALDATAIETSRSFFEGYRRRPHEDEFTPSPARAGDRVTFLDLVNYGFRAGTTFSALVQALIVQKLRQWSSS